MDDRYIAAVDLGSSKIALAVAKIEGEDIQVIYYKEVKSEGIRYSFVFNPQRASEPLKDLLSSAEKELNIKIMQAVVGLPRYYVMQEVATGTIPRSDANSRITGEEVFSLKNLALDNYPLADPQKQTIYGAVAQSFSTDDIIQAREEDVVGMVSEKFEGNFKIFIGNKKSVYNIDNIFNDSGVAIAKSYFTPTTVANAVLTYEEMDNGVALIEFGAGVTSVTVFQDGILRHYAAIPFGGSNVTNDIKMEGGLSSSLAENIKLAYGACLPDKLASLSEKVIKIQYPESGTEKNLPVKYLSEIITAREEEIVEAMLYEIERSGLADNLRSGVVITGGGASMANLSRQIKDISGYNVRIGYPRRKFSYSGCTGVFETSATTCISLLLTAKDDKCINCIEQLIRIPEPEVAETDEDPMYEKFELVSPAVEPEDKGDKKKPQETKTRPPRRKRGLWEKVASKMTDTFDTLGNSIFDGMEDDENDKN